MDKRHFFTGRRFFFGFILLVIGLVMILERSGILSWEVYDFLLSWKMLLVAIGGFVFFSGNRGAGIKYDTVIFRSRSILSWACTFTNPADLYQEHMVSTFRITV